MDHWRRALPFFLISANFGLQAMLVNAQRDTVYTLRFTPQSLLTTIPFYAKQAVINKFGALLLLPLTYFAANREFAKALVGTLALMLPLLFLPGRLFGVYLYVPLLALLQDSPFFLLAYLGDSLRQAWLSLSESATSS